MMSICVCEGILGAVSVSVHEVVGPRGEHDCAPIRGQPPKEACAVSLKAARSHADPLRLAGLAITDIDLGLSVGATSP